MKRPSAAAGLLLWARRTGDIDRLLPQRRAAEQGCRPKKEVGERLKQDLDKDLQLHRILKSLRVHYLTDLLLVKIELLVKILCIFWFIVSFLYYVCFYLRENKDEYINSAVLKLSYTAFQ